MRLVSGVFLESTSSWPRRALASLFPLLSRNERAQAVRSSQHPFDDLRPSPPSKSDAHTRLADRTPRSHRSRRGTALVGGNTDRIVPLPAIPQCSNPTTVDEHKQTTSLLILANTSAVRIDSLGTPSKAASSAAYSRCLASVRHIYRATPSNSLLVVGWNGKGYVIWKPILWLQFNPNLEGTGFHHCVQLGEYHTLSVLARHLLSYQLRIRYDTQRLVCTAIYWFYFRHGGCQALVPLKYVTQVYSLSESWQVRPVRTEFRGVLAGTFKSQYDVCILLNISSLGKTYRHRATTLTRVPQIGRGNNYQLNGFLVTALGLLANSCCLPIAAAPRRASLLQELGIRTRIS